MQQVLMDLPQGKTIKDVCEQVWKLDCAIKPGLVPTQITVLTAEGVSVQQVRDAIGPVNPPKDVEVPNVDEQKAAEAEAEAKAKAEAEAKAKAEAEAKAKAEAEAK